MGERARRNGVHVSKHEREIGDGERFGDRRLVEIEGWEEAAGAKGKRESYTGNCCVMAAVRSEAESSEEVGENIGRYGVDAADNVDKIGGPELEGS